MKLLVTLILAFTMAACAGGLEALPTRALPKIPTARITTTASTQARSTAARSVTPTLEPVCKVKTGLPEGALNLRACGGMDCQILTTLKEEQVLHLVEKGTWLHVSTGIQTGYVYSEYCEVAK